MLKRPKQGSGLSPEESGTAPSAQARMGLRLVETPRPAVGLEQELSSRRQPGRPWFAIALGLLCWLVAGLLILQL